MKPTSGRSHSHAAWRRSRLAMAGAPRVLFGLAVLSVLALLAVALGPTPPVQADSGGCVARQGPDCPPPPKPPAQAPGRAPRAPTAVTITVDRNDDPAVTGAGSGAAMCSAAANDCSLRGATLVANANPGSTINIPAGTYTLSLDGSSEHGDCGTATIGDLDIAGDNTTITGAGSASTIIQQTTAHDRVLCVDQFLVHNFTFTMSGVTITGGKETWGVGGGGMTSGDLGDSVTLSDVVFSGNSVDKTSGGGSPIGGGVGHSGGSFSCTNCEFINNTSVGSGGGMYLSANYTNCIHPCAGTYTLSNVTFSGNSSSAGNGGGLITTSGNSYSVTGSTFTNNSAGSAAGGGGGLYDESGSLTADDDTFTGNQASSGASGNAFGSPDGGGADITANFNRIVGNSGSSSDVHGGSSSTASITNNWWGCNGGPGATGCDTVGGTGTITSSPWIVLKTTASPSTVNYGDSTTLTASFLQNSSSTTLTASEIPVLIGLSVNWTNAAHGSLSSQQTTIQSTGKATATFTAGSTSADCGNVGKAEAEVDNVQSGDTTATATITINCPDLQASKTNNVSGQEQLVNTGSPAANWTWTLTGSNAGSGQARYSSGQTILTDNLPNSNLTYGTVAESNVSGVTGSISCSISSNTLTCSANGSVNIDSSGSFNVSFTATPGAVAVYANPRAAGTCAIDPNNNIPETSDSNNSCSNSVTVVAPDLTVTQSNNVSGSTQLPNNWTWKLHVANGASNATATFNNGDTILTDNLDNSGNLAYGTPTAGNGTNITNIGSVSCSISSNTLTCSATGTVVVGTSGSFDVTFTATPSATGSYSNPRAGGTCAVDPNNALPETNEANNNCNSDSVTVTAPDLTVTQSDNVSGATTLGNNWTWKLHVANGASNAIATFHNGDTILTDDVDNSGNLSFGTPTAGNGTNITNIGNVSCSISSNTLTCAATGTVVVGASGSFDVTFTGTPSAIGSYSSPRAGGTCAVDPNNALPETNEANNNCNTDSVTVTAPDLTISKSNNVSDVVVQGQGWNWTLTLSNAGNAAQAWAPGQTLLRDDLDDSGGVTYSSPSVTNVSNVTNSGSVQCTINGSQTLTCTANGASVTIGTSGHLDVIVPVTSVQGGTYTNPRSGGVCRVDPNNSIVESNESNNDCTPNSVTANTPTPTPAADLAISKTVAATVVAGANGVYTVTLTNDGPDTAQNVSLDDALPVSTTYQSQSQSSGPSFTLSHTGNAIHDTLGSFSAGQTAVFEFTAQFDAAIANGTPITNTASVTSDTGDPSSGNNSASAATQVVAGRLLTISKTHAGGFRQGDVGDTYVVTVTNAGTLPTDGTTVFVTDTLPTGLTATDMAGANWSCDAGALTCSRSDALDTGAAYEPIVVTVTVADDAPATVTNTVTVSGGGAASSAGETAYDPTAVTPAADLTLAKTHSGEFRQGDVGDVYTLTVHNAGPGPTDGSSVVVTDTLPAGLTATNVAGSGWTCPGSAFPCASTAVIAAGSDFPAITLTVNVADDAPTSVTNEAGVSGGGELNAGNDAASDPTNITPADDLTIAKSHQGDFAQGEIGAAYVMTVTNAGAGPSTGVVTVTDSLPTGLIATQILGVNWSCSLGDLTCTRSDVLSSGGAYEPITLTVIVAHAAPATVTNTVSVSGGGELDVSDDTATDPTNITQFADLTIAKTHSGNFEQGDVGHTYAITVTNDGAAATDGSVVTVTDTLPGDLTATNVAGSGWSCPGGAFPCTRSTVLGPGASYAPLTLTVDVSLGAASTVTNTATVSGGGEENTTNDSASDPTTISPRPDLTIGKTHSGDFRQGDVGDVYTLTVHNAGPGPTDGSTVTVTDTLPAGLTATGAAGSGWTCPGNAFPCTSTAVVAAGLDFPAITLTVNVADDAPASVTNQAGVSGGGELDTSDDAASDPTVVTQEPDLVIAKTHDGSLAQGQIGATYQITVSNAGFAATAGPVSVTDSLPAGLTATNVSGVGWDCPGNAFPCDRSDALTNGDHYPAITVTVNVDYGASATVTNTAVVSGGGEVVTSNDTATDVATITRYPNLTIAKTHRGSFVQGDVGQTYLITVTNAGTVPTDGSSVTVTDTMPSDLGATGWTGSGWNCDIGLLTCTRSDALGAGASYPVITLTVNVSDSASPSITNTATVAGGGEVNATDDTANDPTTVTPFQGVTISGAKFDDLNGNGVQNAGEPGLSGWTIQLIDPSNSNVVTTTTTDTNGNYAFPNQPRGTFRVREVQQSGWQQTTANPADITTHSGVDVSNVNFGNFQKITVAGMKFDDLNGNGAQDGGENGLPNWSIQLIDAANSTVITTTTTDAGGNFSFPDLGPGAYRVREVAQSGWIQTTANPADLTASSGSDVAGVLFGNVLPANLTLRKTASPVNPVKGALLTYTLVVTNTGPAAAQAVVVTDTTPAHTTFHALTAPGGWTCTTPAVGGTGQMNCSTPTLADGAGATFQFVVQVDASTPDNTLIANTAHVSSATYQSIASGNSSSAQGDVTSYRYYLPFVGRGIAVGPDLVVQSVTAPSNSNIQVIVKNVGNEATATGFWVDLYVNPNPVPSQANQIWPDVASEGAVWGITSAINPGGTVTLDIGDANYWPSLSTLPASLPAGTQLYAQADSADASTSYGAILETNESNNVSGLLLSATVTLPANHAPARKLPYKNLPNR